MRSVSLPALLLLAACSGGGGAGQQTGNAALPPPPAGSLIECAGLPAVPGPSSSYLPGAAAVTVDGDEVTLELQFIRVEGRACRSATGMTAEIWHTGTTGYDPVLWRTALPVGADGSVSYQTVLPDTSEGTPHFHVRVADYDDRTYEWVFGVPHPAEQTLTMRLLLVYTTESGPPPEPALGV